MLVRLKQGFTGGSDGDSTWTNWTVWHERLHSAGLPVNACLVDTAGQIYEIQESNLSNINDVLIYRVSAWHNGFDPNNPNYNANPADEAIRMLSYKYNNLWPSELDKSFVYLKDTNEIRTKLGQGDTMYNNMSCSEYWGRYGISAIQYAIQNNVRVVLFSPSSADHDSAFWSHPKMFECLSLAAGNRDRIIIGLHEYSYVPENLFALTDNDNATYQDVLVAEDTRKKIGRFKILFDVCDENLIDWPNIYFPEWGWSQDKIPADTNKSLQQIKDAYQYIYGGYDKYIKGFSTWYLSKWNGKRIDQQVNKLLLPTADISINETFDVDEKKPKVESGNGNMECVIPKRKRVSIWIPPFEELDSAQLQQVIIWAESGFIDNNGNRTSGEHMLCPSHEDAIAIHDSGTDDSILAVAYPNKIGTGVDDNWFANNYPCVFNGNKQVVYLPHETQSNPLIGLQLDHLFKYQYAYGYDGGRFNDPRTYGNKLHEGVDADVIGGQVDNKVDVLCTYPGLVDISIDSTGGYGKYVRVKHIRNGSEFYTRYCHLDARKVQAGTAVNAGDVIGEVGSTGNVTGEHVHLNLEVPNYGLRGYVVDWVVDPAPYLPKNSSQLPPLPINPPPVLKPKFGLHFRADPSDISAAEYNEQQILMNAGGNAIKCLHNHPQSVFHKIGQVKPSVVIVRIMEQFNGRTVTPNNFYNWTKDDLTVKLNILAQYGISPIIEMHNEPNLVQEGLTQSWADGREFGNWLIDTVSLFKQTWPTLQYIYPGLSPGETIANIRQDSTTFLQQSIETGVLNYLDGVGCHAYWSSNYPMNLAVDHVNFTKGLTGEKVYVTECSNNNRPSVDSPQEYGRQYAEFINRLNGVEAVLFFVGSASNQYFAPECWVTESQQAKGIAQALVNNL